VLLLAPTRLGFFGGGGGGVPIRPIDFRLGTTQQYHRLVSATTPAPNFRVSPRAILTIGPWPYARPTQEIKRPAPPAAGSSPPPDGNKNINDKRSGKTQESAIPDSLQLSGNNHDNEGWATTMPPTVAQCPPSSRIDNQKSAESAIRYEVMFCHWAGTTTNEKAARQ